MDKRFPVFRQPMVVFDAGYPATACTSAYGPGTLGPEWDAVLTAGRNSFALLRQMRQNLRATKSCHAVQEHHFSFLPWPTVQRMLFHERPPWGSWFFWERIIALLREYLLLSTLSMVSGHKVLVGKNRFLRQGVLLRHL